MDADHRHDDLNPQREQLELLADHRAALDRLVADLLVPETVDAGAVRAAIAGGVLGVASPS